MGDDEKTVHIHSFFKKQGTNSEFVLNFNNVIHSQNARYARVKTFSVPNMFDNVYQNLTKLYITNNGVPEIIQVPSGRYSADELAAAIDASILLNCGYDEVAARFTFDEVAPTIILLSMSSANQLAGERTLNELLGLGTDLSLSGPGNQASTTPCLYGPQRVYIACDRIAFGASVHADGSLHAKLGSISLHNVLWGALAHYEAPSQANNIIWFRDSREINTLDFELLDEFDKSLSMPENIHFQCDLVIGFRY